MWLSISPGRSGVSLI
ncbi:unnamed protein product [Gulo gulo]|uniref:Uncharacterized protein n=1 Tax=Gulo gulo TaxID=48420 RepID=A0A9X9LJB9_GULGU|nr:unnamed protein product [Gulo gulo]